MTKSKIKTQQSTKEERVKMFKEKALLILKEQNNPFGIMSELLDAMKATFGDIDSNEAISYSLDNNYTTPKDLECFVGKTEFSDAIPLVSKNLDDICKMGALEKLMQLDSNTLDSIVSEHNL